MAVAADGEQTPSREVKAVGWNFRCIDNTLEVWHIFYQAADQVSSNLDDTVE